MGSYYVHDGTHLLYTGSATDGTEGDHLKPGEVACLGMPERFDGSPPPFAGARWHVAKCCWTDERTAEQQASARRSAVVANRRAGYPGLEELADALYWERQGDPSKMTAYLSACQAVKERYPKG